VLGPERRVTGNMRNCSEAEDERLDAVLTSTHQSALARLSTDAARNSYGRSSATGSKPAMLIATRSGRRRAKEVPIGGA
jgi:hypothetical protein